LQSNATTHFATARFDGECTASCLTVSTRNERRSTFSTQRVARHDRNLTPIA
jgi:hypothetical protein